MSFGTTQNSQSLQDIIVQASNAGIVMVATAGNNYGGTCEYPAAYEEVVAIGAIDEDGNVTNFSAVEGVEVYVPGVNIYSTYMNDGYVEMNGTSMATPHITGKIINDLIIKKYEHLL